jgi:aspartyl-tRNA(Asn)/glutamyl-tRNA(Gln) amidotransferase subunit A
VSAERYLRRIREVNRSLGAFVEVASSVQDGNIALAVKDNIDVVGFHAAAGMQAYRDRLAERDAPCVAALRRRGAVILGKTLMDEAALGALGDNPFFGRCHNPLRHGYTAGGSSSGSAAAVAAGLCDAALGTDTLGSVRIPASYCGVVGFLPSPGIFSVEGVMPLAPSFDRVGVLAPSVRTAAGLAALSIASAKAAIGVIGAVEDAASALRRAGHRIVELGSVNWPALRRAALLLIEREGAQAHAALLDDPSSGLSVPVRAALNFGRRADAQRLASARARLDDAKKFEDWLTQCEVLLLPTTPQAAFAFDTLPPDSQADFTVPASVLGLPAISVPRGKSDDGLPLGVQLVGRRGADALLLGIAAQLEAATGPPPRRRAGSLRG